MDKILLFMSDYTFRTVIIGSGLIGIISGIIGVFAILRRQSLIGDAISHCALPGICLAFMITGEKRIEVLLLGALISGVTGVIIINFIERYSRIKFDSSLSFILSVFFGFGLVLMTYIQKGTNANQAGLENFIFGQASTVLRRDIQIMLFAGAIIVAIIIIFWKEFKLVSFDSDYATSIGFSSKNIGLMLSILIVITVVIGIQTVGVILMSSMLIAPGVAARQWSNKLSLIVILSAIFGLISSIIGTIISSVWDRVPTGPSIVIVITFIALFSILFAPNRGILFAKRDLKEKRKKIMLEIKNHKNGGELNV